MKQICPVCEYEFKDGDELVAVMLSTFKALDSDTTYAITHPTQCIEIIHRECYDFPPFDAPGHIGGINR